MDNKPYLLHNNHPMNGVSGGVVAPSNRIPTAAPPNHTMTTTPAHESYSNVVINHRQQQQRVGTNPNSQINQSMTANYSIPQSPQHQQPPHLPMHSQQSYYHTDPFLEHTNVGYSGNMLSGNNGGPMMPAQHPQMVAGSTPQSQRMRPYIIPASPVTQRRQAPGIPPQMYSQESMTRSSVSAMGRGYQQVPVTKARGTRLPVVKAESFENGPLQQGGVGGMGYVHAGASNGSHSNGMQQQQQQQLLVGQGSGPMYAAAAPASTQVAPMPMQYSSQQPGPAYGHVQQLQIHQIPNPNCHVAPFCQGMRRINLHG